MQSGLTKQRGGSVFDPDGAAVSRIAVGQCTTTPRCLQRQDSPTSQCAVRTAGTFFPQADFAFGLSPERQLRERNMHGLIYLIGLIVVILFILSLLGLR
jgi:hypothetical protein